MVHPSQVPKHHLNPISTHWRNRSLSSLSAISDAPTFHSAHANLSSMELRQMPFPHQPLVLTSLPPSNPKQPLPSSELSSLKMDRQDSGYAERERNPNSKSTAELPISNSATDSRRTSTSSSIKRLSSPSAQISNTARPKHRTTNSSSSSSTTRPTKRTSRTSTTTGHRSSNSTTRPFLPSRHTVPYTQQIQQSQQPYEFFQFPALDDSSPPRSRNAAIPHQDPAPDTLSSPPPPPTVQYWTSDSTRRLEYAAIDAASKGVRGFFIKLLPDCILPPSTRRTKFHNVNDGDAESDAGSVRRYRLVLPEEKGCCASVGHAVLGRGNGGSARGRGMLRRWTSFGRRKDAME
ncbi:uncharacterized protein RSE6_02863 [Rhynchosporium secalis]|uniref:Uncharacterized protein n=1 Tax=Rhynchosporium secalis TaxID=38038 RepID=A0A1E1M1B4_RHYSE|nr:uncharacterized protein RSE6_02863 [Rhynchosporium secalis]